jgi:hypothetical protein
MQALEAEFFKDLPVFFRPTFCKDCETYRCRCPRCEVCNDKLDHMDRCYTCLEDARWAARILLPPDPEPVFNEVQWHEHALRALRGRMETGEDGFERPATDEEKATAWRDYNEFCEPKRRLPRSVLEMACS